MNICIYCLKQNHITSDHIFPDSWYPSDTPNKWTVPACYDCNQKYGRIEDDLFTRLAVCVDPKDLSASGISQKGLRNINPLTTDDPRKKGRKMKTLMNIFKGFTHYDYIESPAKTLSKGIPTEGVRGKLAIKIPTDKLFDYGTKLGTALEYKIRERLLDGRKVEVSISYKKETITDKYFPIWRQLIASQNRNVTHGPGFSVKYGVDPKNDGTAIYNVSIWNFLEYWIWVIPTDLL